MKREDLEVIEKAIEEEMVKRRKLGGFDANASTILLLTEWMRDAYRHMRENAPRK